MKNHYTIGLILLLGTLSCFAQKSKQEKVTKKWLNNNFLFKEADTLTFFNSPTERSYLRKTEEDSNLVCNRVLFNNKLTARQAIKKRERSPGSKSPRFRIDTSLKATEGNFIICKYEVSNYNYRCFTSYVTDSIVREILIKYGYKKYEIPQKKTDVFGRNYTLNFSEKIDYKDSLIIDVLIKNKLAFDKRERFNVKSKCERRNDKIFYRYIENEIEHVINIYPDTLVWIYDFNYSFFEPLTNMYFWHPSFDDYPVVGVSYLQCLAYIKWRNNNFNDEGIKYRLPTENEFEATLKYSRKPTSGNTKERGWVYNNDYRNLFENGFERDAVSLSKKKKTVVTSKTTYLANIMTRGSFGNDGFFHTNPIDFFPQTDRKIFNLIGNVSEWTSTKLVYDESLTITEIDSLMLIQEESLKYYKSGASNEHYTEYTIKDNLRLLNKLKEDLILIKQRPNNRVVKGGSWVQNETYLHPTARTIFNENQQKSFIGFRLAATIDDAAFKKYFQK